MITSPNDIPNCLLWLDGNDTSTMFREVSVALNSTYNTFNQIGVSHSMFRWGFGGRFNSADNNNSNYQSTGTLGVSPDGLYTASYISDSTLTSNSVRLYQYNVYTPYTDTYTFSFYIRVAIYPYVHIEWNGVSAMFNATTNSLSASAPNIFRVAATDMTEFGPTSNASGWYRISITKACVGSPAAKVLQIAGCALASQSIATSRLGIAGGYFQVYGFMLQRTNTLNSYLGNRTAERNFADGTPVTSLTIPICAVTSFGQEVAYWKNKSLSATVTDLSGLFVYEENSNRKPAMFAWSSGLTALTFSGDYLSSQTLTAPITTTDQTFFAVCYGAGVYNVTREPNMFQDESLSFAVLSQALSGAVNRTTQFDPLVFRGYYGNNSGSKRYGAFLQGTYQLGGLRSAFTWLENLPLPHSRTANDFDTKQRLYRTQKEGKSFKFAVDRIPSYTPNNQGVALTHNSGGGMSNSISGYRGSHSMYNNSSTFINAMSSTTANIFRIGHIEAGTNDYHHRTYNNIAEIIMYDRSLSDSEIDDVEDYLYKKWLVPNNLRPRRVYALDNGCLSSTNIFSISSEPSPFNVLLSSDIIFTNGYTLTATTDQLVGYITNSPTLYNQSGGGGVVMSQGVSLSAKIVGSRAPYTLLVPQNTTCNLVGNVFGGNFEDTFLYTNPASAQNSPGVFIEQGGVLFLSGSAYGGYNRYSSGISTDGGGVYYNGFIYGSGTVSWQPNGNNDCDGSKFAHGLSAINTTLQFENNTIYGTGATCAVYTDRCNVILKNCTVESRYDGVTAPAVNTISVGGTLFGDNFDWMNIALICQNSALTATNTRFIGCTGIKSSPNSTNNYYPHARQGGMAFWQLSGSSYLERCFINGPTRNRNDISSNTPYQWSEGWNQAVRLSTGATMSGVNIIISGPATTFGTTLDEYQNRVSLHIDSGCILTMQGAEVNTQQGYFNIGVKNYGVLTIEGNIKGGYRAGGGASPYRFFGIYNRGLLSIKGTVSPNYNGSAAIFNVSDGSMAITGTFKAGGPLASTILSHGELTAFYSEPLISSIRGRVPVDARQCVFVSLCSTSLYSLFSVDGVETTMVYLGSGTVLNQPLPSDVLLGVTYSPFDALTGTSIIPPLSDTIIGVPVRDSYGTRKPMTVDALWNQTSTTIVGVSSQVYSKLINPFTSAALSALVNSMDYPWSIKT